jgi:tetratricopeptide (TPR) repeat protein
MRFADLRTPFALSLSKGRAEPHPVRAEPVEALVPVRSLTFAMLLALSGCSTIQQPLQALRDAVMPAKAASAPAASASAPAKAASAPTIARPDPEAPVAPALQRSYDDARRALRAGKMDEAERGFKAIAQANPDLGGPHANLGVIYRQANKLPESAGELEQAVRLNPRQPLYFNQLGITYRQQGQFTKAKDAYERAIALDAGYAAPLLNLGILYDLYLWDVAQAGELYGRYLALTPGGDATVTKWVADLKNRKQPAAAPAPAAAASRKEKP